MRLRSGLLTSSAQALVAAALAFPVACDRPTPTPKPPTAQLYLMPDEGPPTVPPLTQWWDGDALLTLHRGPETQDRGVIRWLTRIRPGQAPERLDLPPFTRSVSVHEGTIWVWTRYYYVPTEADVRSGRAAAMFRRPGMGEASEGRLLRCDDFKTLRTAALVKTSEEQSISGIQALGEGRFFLDGSFEEGGHGSGYALGELDQQGHLRIGRLVDVVLDGTPLWGVTDGSEGPRSARIALEVLIDPTLKRTPGSILGVSPSYGWFFTFDGRTGEFRHWIRLFDLPTKDDARQLRGNLDDVVLDIQPRKDGTYLVASRSRHFAAVANREQPNIGQFSDHTLRLMKEDPDVLWWSLDASTGTVTRIPAPPGAITRLDSLRDLKSFRIRFNLDGALMNAED